MAQIYFKHKLPFLRLSSLQSAFSSTQDNDFLELKEYEFNDDARFIAPLASLKYNRLMSKTFGAGKLSFLHLFICESNSLNLGVRARKSETISAICEILLQSAQVYNLKPLLHILNSRHTRTISQIKLMKAYLQTLCEKKAQNPQNTPESQNLRLDFHKVMYFVSAQKRKNGLGVILGDFFDIDLARVSIFRASQNEFLLYALCVRDSEELSAEFLESVNCVRDIESGEIFQNILSKKSYLLRLHAQDFRIRAYFKKLNARFYVLNPKVSLLENLQRIF
ncbi:hypothetical protein ACRE1S_02495 [Helicobacter himalayensis]